MQVRRAMLAVSAGVLIAGLFAWAQGGRKPGLWEITTIMTWQQSPFPPGMQLPPQAAAAFGGAPITAQYCLTQQMIDRFGAPMPQNRAGCQISNVQKTPNSVSADWVCNGNMVGKGSIESHWSDNGTATGKVHFVGTMQMGPNPTPVEWTSQSTSVYKGPDCGSVQPPPLPPPQQ
jgi:Protein of unknown function (DUF3617)